MNETLIRNWNAVVPMDAFVIHDGDFAFGKCTPKEVAEIAYALNGKIILIKGNHDYVAMQAHYKYKIFENVYDDLNIRIITDMEEAGDYIDIHNAHFPKLVWDKKHFGSWHSFGHCHSINPIRFQDINQHDVGVDGNNFTPISFQQFGEIITKRHLEGWNTPH